MRRTLIQLIIILSFSFPQGKIIAQDWEFAKEKDGIKVYTRYENESRYKSFKGEVDIKADIAAVSSLIEDVKNFDRWDEGVTEIRVLQHVQGKMIRYYVVYDVPWPFKDRDLCVEADITTDKASGSQLIQARSVPEFVPLNDDRVRIVDYRQKWIIQPSGNGNIRLIVEGFADPAGDIPAWVVNMAITDTPLNMLNSIRDNLK